MFQYFVLITLIAQWVLYLNWNHIIKRKKFKDLYGRNKSYIIGFFLFFGICYSILVISEHIPSSLSQVPKVIGGIVVKACFVISLITVFAQLFLSLKPVQAKFVKHDLLIDVSSILMLLGLLIFSA